MSSLARLSADMREQHPVFIVGCLRSGSSLLYRLLLAHKDFSSEALRSGDPNDMLAETHLFFYANRSHALSPEEPVGAYNYMLRDRDAFSSFVASISGVRKIHRAISCRLSVLAGRLVPLVWLAGLNHLVVRSYFHHAARVRQVGRLVEKTPDHFKVAAIMRTAFPKARFLLVHRHPVDAFASLKRRRASDADASWARNMDVRRFLAEYGMALRYAVRQQRLRSPAYHGVSYRSLTSDTEAECRKLCDVLGAAFDPGMLRPPATGKERMRADPQVLGPVAADTKDWHDYVDRDDVSTIQEQLAREMKLLGYDPYAV